MSTAAEAASRVRSEGPTGATCARRLLEAAPRAADELSRVRDVGLQLGEALDIEESHRRRVAIAVMAVIDDPAQIVRRRMLGRVEHRLAERTQRAIPLLGLRKHASLPVRTHGSRAPRISHRATLTCAARPRGPQSSRSLCGR